MLYPIELLRHCASTPIGASEDGEHLNDLRRFCHVVIVRQQRSPDPKDEPP